MALWRWRFGQHGCRDPAADLWNRLPIGSMKNNLFARFGLIFGALILIIGLAYPWKLKGGIDLVGGTDLLYELDLSHYQGDTHDLADRVIKTLKRRVDPNGVRNLVWRVVGGNRIEVQMPLADKETRDARREFQTAQSALRASNLQMFQVTAAIDQAGAKRQAALDALAPAGTPERASLDKLAAAADARRTADKAAADYGDPSKIPGPVLDALDAARAAYDAAFNEVKAHNLDVAEISDLMTAAENNTAAAAKLKSILEKPEYAGKKPLLEKLQAAYNVLQQHKGGGLDDPEELERLVSSSGVLDFRIAVERTDPAMAPIVVQAHTDLEAHGPSKAITNAKNVRWYEIDAENGAELATDSRLAIGKWGGKNYILLYDDRAHALTHDPARDWKLTKAFPSVNQDQQPIVSFSFDPNGQQFFGELTLANVTKPMAILLDDKAIQAPNIHEAITGGSGQITFGSNRDAEATRKEVETLVQILDAGSLPATLQREPISKKTIDSALGDDNIKAGLRSGVIAVIAVMAFMVVYYTITGFFADVALLINLILLLSSMAMLQATFTLPGIAGIVLTLGMAVDANVLINERIREELHKGASLWNAVKLGYDKVFWTIFDANTTTSLTSIVLIYVASEEVKGFGVTLLIGLIIHMFTALFVTRTLMIAAIRWGVFKAIDDLSLAEYFRDILTGTWLRGRWPFMRVFHLTNFDWLGKRHIFWGVSAVTIVAGLVVFALRGPDKYDTEFNGGTDVSFTVKAGKDIDTAEVRRRVYAIPEDPHLSAEVRDKLRDLKQANIYQVRSETSTAKQFEIVTTIADHSSTDKTGAIVIDKRKQLLLDTLLATFSDVMDAVEPIDFAGRDTNVKDLRTLLEQKTIFPILKPVITGDQVGGPAAIDALAYQGGVAIVLDFGSKPQPLSTLKRRISDQRHSEGEKAAVDRMSDVIPVIYAPGDLGAKGFVTRAVLLVSDPKVSYETEPARWQAELAAGEWQLVQTAMTKSGGFQGITSFDPQVADAAKAQAVVSVGISLILIVIYVWIRFGGIRYGLGAIFSLVHDAIVAIAATVLAGVFARHFPKIADALLIGDFKINLTMIAAYLTVIGYSVNDTIVIFDRIRENRGRAHLPLTAKLVNDSINQCFGRTIWTTFTVFIVVLIMYIWGGEGVRGFSFAMLVGVITGAYSTLAIASPMLLHVKDAPKAELAKVTPAIEPEIGPR